MPRAIIHPEGRTARITAAVPEALLKKARAVCKDKGINLSHFITEGIRQAVAPPKTTDFAELEPDRVLSSTPPAEKESPPLPAPEISPWLETFHDVVDLYNRYESSHVTKLLVALRPVTAPRSLFWSRDSAGQRRWYIAPEPFSDEEMISLCQHTGMKIPEELSSASS